MRIISLIDQPEVIKKILQYLGLWEESHASPVTVMTVDDGVRLVPID